MIIVKLQGGLGNQMFQYASAFAISKSKNSRLKLDLSFYRNSLNRVFTLNNFLISSEIIYCPPLFIIKVLRKTLPATFCNGLLFIPPYNKIVIKEKTLEFDPSVFELPDNIYLEGYWQSEKYFTRYHDEITKEFTFTNPPNGINVKFAADILEENSVSLHIRRGDYVNNKSNTKIYSRCTLDYYEKAVKYIIERVDKPVFYVFSDDPEWGMGHFKIEYPILFINHNKGKDYEDLRLMSLCKHNIIANSTFSWWGAWLNKNPQKIVIAPAKWFENDIKTDIIPEGWIRI